MDKLKIGDKVKFNHPFENADARIERGDIGIIRALPVGLGLYSVVAKKIVWLCKEHEITKQENPNAWNAEEYEQTFYANMPVEMAEALTDENREQLKPLIKQACEQRIETMALIEIVKQGMS